MDSEVPGSSKKGPLVMLVDVQSKHPRGDIPKKRKNVGKKKQDNLLITKTPVSVKKVKNIKKVSANVLKQTPQGYRLIDLCILQDVLSCLLCTGCQQPETLFLFERDERKKGLSSNLNLCCDCGFQKEFFTSQPVKKCTSKQGNNPFDVNIRAVYGMRSIGADHASLEKLCGFFNMPKPMTPKNFTNISNNLRDAAKTVAKRSMLSSIEELRCLQNAASTDVIDIGVSVDGTWQRRGFSSLNGVLVAVSIDSGKIVDIEPMSRYCRECSVNNRLLQDKPDELAAWKINHRQFCKLNHDGSAPSMEIEGAKRIFSRSLETYNVQYTGFYGDGDSKAFTEVKDMYGPDTVTKYECIGHYQKRVGSRLRKLKKRVKGLKELNDSTIDKLQNYFGIALRENCTTVKKMSDAILVSFFHVASSEGRKFHSYYKKSSDSWCQYQKDVCNGTNLHVDGPGLSNKVIMHVKPIYQDLAKPQELRKCLHGKTQNQNESYNSMIWARAPKYRYCAFDKLEFAVYDSSANFNDGRQASLDILKEMNVIPGFYIFCLCYNGH